MNRLIVAILVLLSFSAFPFDGMSQSKKKTVAVLEFNSTSRVVGKDELYTLTNRFRTILVKTEAFDVLERQKMKDILKEQDFTLSDACNSAECAVQVGQLLGVEYMIAGDVGKLGNTYSVDVRLISVTTGKIVQTENQDYNGQIDGLFGVLAVIGDYFAGIKSANSNREENSFTDPRDGKTYKTVKIGYQVWMAENLNYDVGEGCYCYEDKSSNCSQYGKLYTWEAAKKAVPPGWRLPSKSDFAKLILYLGGDGRTDEKLLESWDLVDYGRRANEKLQDGGSSQFDLLEGGYRTENSKYLFLGWGGFFWSSSEVIVENRILGYTMSGNIGSDAFVSLGGAVTARVYSGALC